MQVPQRKPGKYSNLTADPHITQKKKNELEDELASLLKKRPKAASEVQRLSELGDFSENAEYQLAKGKLRGMNRRILVLEDHLNRAIVVQQSKSDQIQLGDTVTLTMDGEDKTYTILGPSETDPSKNIISHLSPIGSALIGKRVDDVFEIEIAGNQKQCKIFSKN